MELIKANAKATAMAEARAEIAKELTKSQLIVSQAEAHFTKTIEDAAMHHALVQKELLADASAQLEMQKAAAELAFKNMTEKINEEKRRK